MVILIKEWFFARTIAGLGRKERFTECNTARIRRAQGAVPVATEWPSSAVRFCKVLAMADELKREIGAGKLGPRRGQGSNSAAARSGRSRARFDRWKRIVPEVKVCIE